jgi:hypothetical protein
LSKATSVGPPIRKTQMILLVSHLSSCSRLSVSYIWWRFGSTGTFAWICWLVSKPRVLVFLSIPIFFSCGRPFDLWLSHQGQLNITSHVFFIISCFFSPPPCRLSFLISPKK